MGITELHIGIAFIRANLIHRGEIWIILKKEEYGFLSTISTKEMIAKIVFQPSTW